MRSDEGIGGGGGGVMTKMDVAWPWRGCGDEGVRSNL